MANNQQWQNVAKNGKSRVWRKLDSDFIGTAKIQQLKQTMNVEQDIKEYDIVKVKDPTQNEVQFFLIIKIE